MLSVNFPTLIMSTYNVKDMYFTFTGFQNVICSDRFLKTNVQMCSFCYKQVKRVTSAMSVCSLMCISMLHCKLNVWDKTMAMFLSVYVFLWGVFTAICLWLKTLKLDKGMSTIYWSVTYIQNQENQSPYTVYFLTLITQNCTQEKSSGGGEFPKPT